MSICAAVAEYILSEGRSTRLDSLTRGREELLIPVRVIASTDRSILDIGDAAASTPLPDFDTLRALSPFFVPLFKGPRLIFSSAEIASAAYAGHSRVSFPIDYSFSFDANVADKIRAYLLGANPHPADKARVIELIRLIKQHAWRVDIMPCLTENMRHARLDDNRRPLETMLAFRLLDQLDVPAFLRDPETRQFLVDPASLREQAAGDVRKLLTLSTGRRREASALSIYALLLKLSELWLLAPDEPQKNFSRLIDFSLFEVGAFAKLELSIALDFLRHPRSLNFFGPLTGLSK